MSWWHRRRTSDQTAAAIAHLDTATAEIAAAKAILLGSTPEPPEPDDVIEVGPGDDLRSVIEQAPAGATLRIDVGYTYDLGVLTISKPLTLESSAAATLPPGRVTPSLVGPQLRGEVAFTAPGIVWRGLRLEGTGQTMITAGPATFLDRCLLLGRDTAEQHRGVAANAPDISIYGCHIGNVWADQDSQAVCGWDGMQHLSIRDSFLEASGENFMAGGADASSADRMAADVLIEDCTFSKPTAWMTKAGCVAKNLLELKAVKGCTIRRCHFEYSWAQGQAGYAIVVTVRNQNGQAIWSTIEDVLIEDNTIRHVAGGFSFLGRDDEHESQVMQRVTVRRNTIEDLSRSWAMPGKDPAGRAYFISGGPNGLVLEDNNTNLAPGSVGAAITFDQKKYPVEGLVVRGCELYEGDYGINGQCDAPLGVPQLEGHCPHGYTWEAVTLQRGTSGRKIEYPAGTTVLPPIA